jgi:glycosyltransferase involved in cell wall biosynthesis
MLEAFPGAPLYTALFEPEQTFPEFANHDIRPLWTNRVAALRRDHRRGLLVFPWAFSRTLIDADAVLCSTSGFAHCVRTTGQKTVYCHNPPRWLYDQAPTFLGGWPRTAQIAMRGSAPLLRALDRRGAQSADAYVANSNVVKQRIATAYGLDALVLSPPPADPLPSNTWRAPAGVEPGFVLCVSRLLSYKNVAQVVAACSGSPGLRLVVVGDGPERARVEASAGRNVTLLGSVDDRELAWLYANSCGLVAAAYEDFGLTPLEAASYGTPAAVLRFGGFLDTVMEGKTGVFFDSPSPACIAAGIRALSNQPWDVRFLCEHAASFGAQRFRAQLRGIVRTATDSSSCAQSTGS